jgi:hypothetical protein
MTRRIKFTTTGAQSRAERLERERTVPEYVKGSANRGAWWKGYKASKAYMPKRLNPYRSEGSKLRGMRGPTRIAILAAKWDEGWVYYHDIRRTRSAAARAEVAQEPDAEET